MSLRSFLNKTIIVAVLLAVSCSDGRELVQLDQTDNFVLNRISVTGEVCSQEPPSLPIKNYIMFIVDRSASMLVNQSFFTNSMGQPSDTTKEAIRDVNNFVINATAAGVADLHVGIITYSTVVNVIAPFTAGGVTDTDINNIPDPIGTTNIADAITTAEQEIEAVIDQVVADDEDGDYNVAFTTIMLGDGNADNGEPGEQLIETKDEIVFRAGRITRFDQIYPWVQTRMAMHLLIGADLQGSPSLLAKVRDLFICIAAEFVETGSGGSYEEIIADPGNPQAFTFDTPNINATAGPNQIKSLFAANINVVPDSSQGIWDFHLDSDGDGLTDDEELVLGSDPLVYDTDGDGCGDHTESITSFDPQVVDCDCDDDGDRDDPDGDGLVTCEEKLNNTNPFHPDSDGDAIPDRFEVLNKMNANDFNDALLNKDGDSINNREEFFYHLDLNNSNPPNTDAISYRYDLNTAQINAEGQYCVTFTISNIMVLETLQGGVNNIQVVALEDANNQVLQQNRYNLVNIQVTYINDQLQGPSSYDIALDDWTAN